MRPRDRWPTVPLGTLAEFRNGVNYNKENFGTGIKVIGVSDFQDHVRASFNHLEQINPEGVVRKEHLLRDGDILFVRSNGNRDLIGRSLFVSGLRENVTHSAFSIRLRFASSQCCPRFYAYLFRSTLIRQALSMYGGGTNISNLNQGILERLEVPLPTMPVQERIASILTAYDDLIENNTRRIKSLEDMAQMIYRERFVNFRFPGHEKVRIVESELGPIPEGWSVGTVSQMAILHREGINPANFPNEVFLHFSIPSFDNNRTPVREKGIEIKSNKYRVVPGCVLLSKLNPRIPRLWMPSVGSGVREITSTEFLVLTPPVAAHKTYLFQFFSSEEFSGSLTGRSLGTSTSHQRVKPDDFLNLPSILPARSVMDEFCRYVDPMMEETSLLRSKNNNLRTTRDLLLPKLISGDIPIETSDEAAAELLEQTA